MPKKKKEECKGFPAWLTSFGDLMSLLLTFFILLFSMSTINIQKFVLVLKSLLTVFKGPSVLKSGTLPEGMKFSPFPKAYPKFKKKEIKKVLNEVKKFLKKSGLKAQVVDGGDYITIRILADDMFDPCSVEVKSKVIPAIKYLEEKLKKYNVPLLISGHTDNSKPKTCAFLYPTNWELSAARAVSVLRLFLKWGYPLDKLSAAGFGPYHPIAPNDTPEHRKLNRRVEFTIRFK